MADDPRAPHIPASDPLPDGLTADRPESDTTAPRGAEPPARPEPPRTPDEYLETPGSHRRPDGAATDVGA